MIFLNLASIQAHAISCGKPDFDRTEDRGIYLWQNCSTKKWFFRVSSGGRPSGDEFRVSGKLSVNKPLLFVEEFSVENGSTGSQDLFDIMDPGKVEFIFRVWGSAQDGFNFRLRNNTLACMRIDPSINMPIVIGKENLEVFPPVNLMTLDQAGCLNIEPTLDLLLFSDMRNSNQPLVR